MPDLPGIVPILELLRAYPFNSRAFLEAARRSGPLQALGGPDGGLLQRIGVAASIATRLADSRVISRLHRRCVGSDGRA